MTREVRHLNRGWRFQLSGDPHLRDPGFDDAALAVVDLPHTLVEVPHAHVEPEAYQTTGTYRRFVDVGPLTDGRRAILHVEGALTTAEVYVDGRPAGGHVGGWTPFRVDLTDHLRADGTGTLAVVVDGTEDADVPPFGGPVDFLGYGGLYREVRLEVVPELHVTDVVVRAEGVTRPGAYVQVTVELAGPDGPAAPEPQPGPGASLEIALVRDGVVVARAEQDVPGAPAGTDGLRVAADLAPERLDLWGPGHPALYDVQVTLRVAGRPADEVVTRTGFREAEFRPDGFYLNGHRLVLRGLNRHQSFPYVGAAMPRSAQRRDAEILAQELGVNVVRLSHYPQSRHFLDACDELGLLVFEEMPGWQHIGGPRWRARAVADVDAMVRRDRNRPGVIAWGVRINESPDDDELYRATNARARTLDPTRPTGGVRNSARSHLLEDVYTYNDFVHRGDNRALQPARSVAGARVPYLVTEHTGHMYPTTSADPGSRRVEHALRHLRVLDAAYAAPDVAGAIGWCMVDYPTHREFGHGDRICYHGVLDAFRVPKPAAAAYASQQDDRPVLEIASSMVPGECDASEIRSVHVLTNCDEVRLLRNGVPAGRFHPDRAGYPALPHPPVVVADLVGEVLAEREGFSPRDARRATRVLRSAMAHGRESLPWADRLRLAWVRRRYRLTAAQVVALYTTYIGGWGASAVRWDVEGYVDGRLVATDARGADGVGRLRVTADAAVLVEQETYDVTRVVVQHVDDAGTRQVYTDVVVRVDVEGPARVIGPTTVALVGGARAFWVRSTGAAGPVTVRVSNERFGVHEVRLRVTTAAAPPPGAPREHVG